MANDCDYRVVITGEEENLSNLNQSLKCEPIESDGILRNESYHILFKDTTNVEWGSKWTVFNDIEYDTQYPDDLSIKISGYSAWRPSTGFWKKISEEYGVNLTLHYYEKAMDFAGIIQFENGQQISHQEMTYWEYNYLYDYDYMWQEIEDQCSWDDLDGVKETLKSIWIKFTSSEIKRIEEQFEKIN